MKLSGIIFLVFLSFISANIDSNELSPQYSFIFQDEPSVTDSLFIKFPGIYTLPRYIYHDTTFVSSRELLTDKILWRHLENASYDALPNELRLAILNRQFSNAGYLLDSLFWQITHQKDWDAAPVPVRTAVYLLMIKMWTNKLKLDKYAKQDDASTWFIAMMLQESFLNHNAVNDNGDFKDIGLAQLSHPVREKLLTDTIFLKITNLKDKIIGYQNLDEASEIFFNPFYAAAAGVYVFRNRLDEAKGDLNTAIMSYNVGIYYARKKSKRAQKYLDFVKYRYNNYVKGQKSETWNYIFNYVKTYEENSESDKNKIKTAVP